MSDICGRCAHHYEGQERSMKITYKDPSDKKGTAPREGIVVQTEFHGHTSHPNGKCLAPSGPYKGVVTGFYGHCEKFQERGAPARMHDPLPQEIDDFTQVV